MPADEGAELRDALKALQDARQAGDTRRAETALERALLTDFIRRHPRKRGKPGNCRQAAHGG